MLVSMYNTYVNTTTNEKPIKAKLEFPKEQLRVFSQKTLPNAVSEHANISKSLPVDYVSNNKTFLNQQKILSELKPFSDEKFKKLENKKSAKTAYETNSIMFPLIKKPGVSLSLPVNINRSLPINVQNIVESNLKKTMVNTYIANENYYKITA